MGGSARSRHLSVGATLLNGGPTPSSATADRTTTSGHAPAPPASRPPPPQPDRLAADDVTRQRPQAEHRVTIRLVGEALDLLDALSALEGRPAHQLVDDWVRAELARAASRPEVGRFLRQRRRDRRQGPQLRAVD